METTCDYVMVRGFKLYFLMTIWNYIKKNYLLHKKIASIQMKILQLGKFYPYQGEL